MKFNNIKKDKNFVIVGAGETLSTYKDPILSFIKDNKAVTIGINRMTGVITPDYHLWTNRQRWGKYGSCVKASSKLILGPSITSKYAQKHYRGKYDRIDYADKKGTPFEFKGEQIRGYFRTAGVLAIALAHIMGAKEVFIVGMDGYTLHDKRSLKKEKFNQHCYGAGHTDDSSWKECAEKDHIVYGRLSELQDSGIEFSILTPTVFDKFYKNKLNLK
tara:strand:+ start:1398 stop:2048 length:651 start_codon:yes stop_codon:yes gene_type:complete